MHISRNQVVELYDKELDVHYQVKINAEKNELLNEG